MALILNIETSSPHCSVCLAAEGKLIAHKSSMERNAHAGMLTVLIEEIMRENNASWDQLSAVAVGAGPGSYTGLRIGVAIAKGLCFALNKPLIAVPTLLTLWQRMIEKINMKNVYYLPVIDARRMDVYTALFDAEGNEIVKTACVSLDDEFERSLAGYGAIYVGGDAAVKYGRVFANDKVCIMDDITCDARWMINNSFSKYDRQAYESLAYYEPLYLKEFIPLIKKL